MQRRKFSIPLKRVWHWIVVFFLPFLVSCNAEEGEIIECVTALDCPLGWFCEDGICVETPDTVPGDADRVSDRDISGTGEEDGNTDNESIVVTDDSGLPTDTPYTDTGDVDVADGDAVVDNDIVGDEERDEEGFVSDEDEDSGFDNEQPLPENDLLPDSESITIEDDMVPLDDTSVPDADADIPVPICSDGKDVLADGLVLYLRMDEPPLFSTVYDSSANPVSGKFSTGASLGNAGIRGGALAFNQYSNLQVPDTTKLDLPGEMSASIWVNLPDNGAGNTRPYMVFGKGSGHQANFAMFREPDRTISFIFHNWIVDGIVCGVKSATNPIDDGQWHHVVGTYDGTYTRIYVDGVLESTSPPCTIVPILNDHPVTIGQVAPAFQYTDPYSGTGYIDEVRLYNRVLSPEEVLLLKNGVHEYCDDGNLFDGDGCSNTCQVESGFLCYGSPSICITPPTWQCTHSIQLCDNTYDYYDPSLGDYYYQSWVGTSLQAISEGSVLWTSPSFSTYQWVEYTPGAKCWGTWYNYTFTSGKTVDMNYAAKGAYKPNQCYFQIRDAANGAGNTITTTSPTGSGQWPANYSYTGTCLQP